MAEIPNNHRLDGAENGKNYQPQLVNAGFQPSTVSPKNIQRIESHASLSEIFDGIPTLESEKSWPQKPQKDWSDWFYSDIWYVYIVSGATKKERSQRFHAIFRTHLRSQPLHGVNPSSVEMELALVNLFLPIQ